MATLISGIVGFSAYELEGRKIYMFGDAHHSREASCRDAYNVSCNRPNGVFTNVLKSTGDGLPCWQVEALLFKWLEYAGLNGLELQLYTEMPALSDVNGVHIDEAMDEEIRIRKSGERSLAETRELNAQGKIPQIDHLRGSFFLIKDPISSCLRAFGDSVEIIPADVRQVSTPEGDYAPNPFVSIMSACNSLNEKFGSIMNEAMLRGDELSLMAAMRLTATYVDELVAIVELVLSNIDTLVDAWTRPDILHNVYENLIDSSPAETEVGERFVAELRNYHYLIRDGQHRSVLELELLAAIRPDLAKKLIEFTKDKAKSYKMYKVRDTLDTLEKFSSAVKAGKLEDVLPLGDETLEAVSTIQARVCPELSAMEMDVYLLSRLLLSDVPTTLIHAGNAHVDNYEAFLRYYAEAIEIASIISRKGRCATVGGLDLSFLG